MPMPSEERYQKLVAALRKNKSAFAAAVDEKARLDCGLEDIRAFILYLHGDKDVLDECLTAPIGAIESAVYDAGQGANPSLLQHSPLRPGKPAFMAKEQVQGGLAAALHILKVGNWGAGRAADWVARKAREHGVFSEDGAPISARQITSCRKDIGGRKGPKGAIEAHDMIVGAYTTRLKQLPEGDKRRGCEALAEAAIKSLAADCPQSGPKQQNRTNSRK